MLNAAVVVNSFWRGGDAPAERIRDELAKLGVNAEVVTTVALAPYIENKINCKKYDFCVFLDKDEHVSYLLTAAGVPLFNSSESIRISDDKMLTHIALAKEELPQPKTISAPLFFAGEDTGIAEKRAISEIGFPMVVKKCYGAFGKQVWLAHNEKELMDICQGIKGEKHIFQKYIECGASDYRLIVIGGKVVAAMKRSATKDGEFRSNIELGGKGEKIEPNKELKALAEAAAKAIGLDFCGVDVIQDENGKYYITEVNSNAHFAGIEAVTGVNVAKLYAVYILEKIATLK